MAFNNNKAQVTLQINGEEVVSKLKAMQKEITAAGLEMKKLNAEGKDTSEIAKKIETLGKEYQKLSREAVKTATAAKEIGGGVADGEAVASNSLRELRKELRIASRDFERAELGSEAATAAADRIKALKTQIEESQAAIKLYQKEAEKPVVTGLEAQVAELKELRKAFDELPVGAEGATEAAKKIAELEIAIADASEEAKNFKKTARFDALTSVSKDLRQELEKVKQEMKGLDKTSDEFKQAEAKAKKLEKAIEGVESELSEMKKEGSDLSGIEGAFQKLQDGLESKFGSIGKSIAGAFAIGVIVAFATEAIGFLGDITAEFSELRRSTAQFTSASGQDLDNYTAKVAAISKTFDQDNKEILQSANALSKQMGISFDAALNIISEGFAKGADLNGEFLDSLKEYPAQAKAAGLSAQEFLTILEQSAKDGVFSDKGIDTIKEFGLRIREQTKPTQEALEGLFGKEKSAQLLQGIRDGSLSTLDVLEQVSAKMNDTTIPANKLQTAIADIFGSAGEDAGLPFIQSLKDLRKSTQEYATANSELISKQKEKLEAERNLAQAELELSKILDPLISKTKLYATEALTAVLAGFGEIFKANQTWTEIAGDFLNPIGRFIEGVQKIGKTGKTGFDTVTAAALETNKVLREQVGLTAVLGEAKPKTIPIGIAAPIKQVSNSDSELDKKRAEEAKREAERRRKEWESAKEKADAAAKAYDKQIVAAETNLQKLQNDLQTNQFDKQIGALNLKAQADIANLSNLREVADARIKTLSGSKATIKAQTKAINDEVESEINKQTQLIKQLADRQIAEIESKRAEAQAKAAESIRTDNRTTTTTVVEGKATAADIRIKTLQESFDAELRLVEAQANEQALTLEQGLQKGILTQKEYDAASEKLALLKEDKILSVMREASVEQSAALKSRYEAQLALAEDATQNTIANLRKEKAERLKSVQEQEGKGELNPDTAASARLAIEKRYNSAIRAEEEKLAEDRKAIYQEYTNDIDAISDKQVAQFISNEKLKTEALRSENEKKKELQKELAQAGVEVATIVSDTLFQIAEQNAEYEKGKNLEKIDKDKTAALNAIDKKKEADIKAAGENKAEKERIEIAYQANKDKIDQEAAAKKEAIEKAAHESQKKRSISQAIVNGALAITTILAQTPKFDFGVATAIAIGLAIATTAAQVAVIRNQKFERGGIAQGAPHSAGGIKMIDSGSGRIVGEMEGGEPYMILSKETYKNNGGIINRLLHSSMNEGGKPIFEKGGVVRTMPTRYVPKFEIGGIAKAPNTTPTIQREAIMVKVEIPEMKELSVLITEIRQLATAIRTQPIEVYAPVVLTEVEAGLAELSTARANARVA